MVPPRANPVEAVVVVVAPRVNPVVPTLVNPMEAAVVVADAPPKVKPVNVAWV